MADYQLVYRHFPGEKLHLFCFISVHGLRNFHFNRKENRKKCRKLLVHQEEGNWYINTSEFFFWYCYIPCDSRSDQLYLMVQRIPLKSEIPDWSEELRKLTPPKNITFKYDYRLENKKQHFGVSLDSSSIGNLASSKSNCLLSYNNFSVELFRTRPDEIKEAEKRISGRRVLRTMQIATLESEERALHGLGIESESDSGQSAIISKEVMETAMQEEADEWGNRSRTDYPEAGKEVDEEADEEADEEVDEEKDEEAEQNKELGIQNISPTEINHKNPQQRTKKRKSKQRGNQRKKGRRVDKQGSYQKGKQRRKGRWVYKPGSDRKIKEKLSSWRKRFGEITHKEMFVKEKELLDLSSEVKKIESKLKNTELTRNEKVKLQDQKTEKKRDLKRKQSEANARYEYWKTYLTNTANIDDKFLVKLILKTEKAKNKTLKKKYTELYRSELYKRVKNIEENMSRTSKEIAEQESKIERTRKSLKQMHEKKNSISLEITTKKTLKVQSTELKILKKKLSELEKLKIKREDPAMQMNQGDKNFR